VRIVWVGLWISNTQDKGAEHKGAVFELYCWQINHSYYVITRTMRVCGPVGHSGKIYKIMNVMDRYGSHYLFPSTPNTLFCRYSVRNFLRTYPCAAFTLPPRSIIKRHTQNTTWTPSIWNIWYYHPQVNMTGVKRKPPYPWIKTLGDQTLIVSSPKQPSLWVVSPRGSPFARLISRWIRFLGTLYHFHSFSLRPFRPLETL
jgi:hypothetical protein